MSVRYLNQLFTPSVKAAQQANGSRQAYARADDAEDGADALTPRERMFISLRDSFYMATNNASGWPYIQHRGGPVGFVKVLGERTLAFADFRGNRQYISLGNLAEDDRAALFFMDYAGRARLKILGRVRSVDVTGDAALAGALIDPAYGARTERALVVDVDSYDWNCPQHITPRYTEAEVEGALAPLRRRIAELEAALAGGVAAKTPPAG